MAHRELTFALKRPEVCALDLPAFDQLLIFIVNAQTISKNRQTPSDQSHKDFLLSTKNHIGAALKNAFR